MTKDCLTCKNKEGNDVITTSPCSKIGLSNASYLIDKEGNFSCYIAENNSTFVKHDSDKPKYYMIIPSWLRGIAEVLTSGAITYSPDNWKNYEPTEKRPESATNCYYSAMMRHVEAWREGEKYDKKTGKHHLLHASCCIMFMFWFDTNK
jgi:hypothetical protein